MYCTVLIYILFTIILNNYSYSESDNSRCFKGKAAAYCGSGTKPTLQFYYDIYSQDCRSYIYCVATNEAENSVENRFSSKDECREICKQGSKKVTLTSVKGKSTQKTNKNSDKSKKSETKKVTSKGSENVLQKNQESNISEKNIAQSNNSIKPTPTSRKDSIVSHGNPPDRRNKEFSDESENSDPRDEIDEVRKNQNIKKEDKDWMCHQPRPYNYCYPKSVEQLFWYFDSETTSCKVFKDCADRGSKQIYITENRFPDHSTCENICLK